MEITPTYDYCKKYNAGNDIGWKLAIPGWQEGEVGRGKNGTAAFQNSGVPVHSRTPETM